MGKPPGSRCVSLPGGRCPAGVRRAEHPPSRGRGRAGASWGGDAGASWGAVWWGGPRPGLQPPAPRFGPQICPSPAAPRAPGFGSRGASSPPDSTRPSLTLGPSPRGGCRAAGGRARPAELQSPTRSLPGSWALGGASGRAGLRLRLRGDGAGVLASGRAAAVARGAGGSHHRRPLCFHQLPTACAASWVAHESLGSLGPAPRV